MPVPDSNAVSAEPSRRTVLLAGGLLLLAAFAAYHNTFALPFVFDDRRAIVDNLSIRELWLLTDVLSPPNDGSSASGRPLVNLSFALNHAISGDAVWSYHALNLLIHVGAGLALFGLVRRTLLRPVFSARVRAEAWPLGFSVAALWLLHPLQTESVTCVVQRTESMVGMFYLLTLYGFVRAVDSPRPAGWQSFSVAMGLLGMATKEVMVTAPVLVLAYDRTFVAGTLREAWRQRRGYYLALAATWLLLAALLLQAGGARSAGAGFGLGVTPWDYALTQCRALVLYLKLAVWPHPLVLDYGMEVVRDWREVWPQGLLVLSLLAATAWTWWRRPAVGFAGVAFFVILAPSSSVVPLVGQTMAEHRMYLPLAAVVALLVVGCQAVCRRATWWWLGVVAVGFGVMTAARNRDYRSEPYLWADVVQKYPQNARGQFNFATDLAKEPGRAGEAAAHFLEALRLKPDFPEAHYRYAGLLATQTRRSVEAVAHYEVALRLFPGYAEAHNDLSAELLKLPGRLADAIAHGEAALALRPGFAEAHCNLGNALAAAPGRLAEAIAHYEAALRLKPDYAEAHNNLAAALGAQPGRRAEAIAHYEAALRLRPGYAGAHNNLALELAKTPARIAEAISHYEEALRLKPDFAEAHCNLGAALAPLPDRLPEAIGHFEAAVRLNPAYLLARSNLALAYANSGRLAEAATQLEAVLAQAPGQAEARRRLRSIRALLAR
jgi:tetratricopeptide (TPR) repeat protein